MGTKKPKAMNTQKMKMEDKAIQACIDAITDVVKECGLLGAPCGIIYAAFSAHGVTLTNYKALEKMVLRTGKVIKRNDCLYYKDPGRTLIAEFKI